MIPSQVVEPFLFRNQYHQKKQADEAEADKLESNTSFQPVDKQKQLVTQHCHKY